jgi:hypothetical protein
MPQDERASGMASRLTDTLRPLRGALDVWFGARVGWLLPLALLVTVPVAWQVCSQPTYGGYTWLTPAWVFRSVVFREWFPTVAFSAWLLGVLSSKGRRASLQASVLSLLGRYGSPGRVRRRTGVLLVVSVVVVLAAAFRPNYTPTDLAACAAGGLSLVHRKWRGTAMRAVAFDLLRVILMFLVVSYVFTLVKSQLFVYREPADKALIDLESAIFGEPPHRWIARFTQPRPWLSSLFDEVYFRLFDHMAVASFFLMGAGLQRERARLWVSLAMCYLIGGFSYFILPGLGPCYVEPSFYSFLESTAPVTYETQRALLANSEAMRSNDSIVISTYAFVACMPSLHMAHEFVMLYYARASRIFFTLSTGFVALTWISTMGLGWHYAIDVLGGALLAAGSVLIANRNSQRLFPLAVPSRVTSPIAEPSASGWSGLLLVVVVLVTHGATLLNGFVLDDIHLIANAHLRELEDLLLAASTGQYHLSGDPRLVHVFRPLAGAANWICWQIARDVPSSQHVLNLACAAVLLEMLRRLLRQLGVSVKASLAAVMLVALHPLSSEVFAYCSARDMVLGWLVWIAFLRMELRSRSASFRPIALGTALAALTHESFLLIGAAAILLPISAPARSAAQRRLWRGLGYGCGVGAALLFRTCGAPEAWVLANPLVALGGSMTRAVRMLAFPTNLSPLVSVAPEPKTVGFGALVLLVVATVGGSLASRHRAFSRLAGAASLVAAGACLSQAYGASVTGVLTDRGTFSVLVGLALGIAPAADALGALLASRVSLFRQRALLAGAAALSLTALVVTRDNGLVYGNDQALADRVLVGNPSDPLIQARAGLMLAHTGDPETAARICRDAARSSEVSSDVELCLAVVASREGANSEALSRVTRYVEQHPGSIRGRDLLWALLIKSGRNTELRDWTRRLRAQIGDQPDVMRMIRTLRPDRSTISPSLAPPG